MDRLNGFDPIKITLLSTSAWLSLSKTTRAALAVLFNLPKTGTPSASIGSAGSKIESDGYTAQDLANITVTKMQAILDSDSNDFYGLFEQVVRVIENPQDEIMEIRGEGIFDKNGEPKTTKVEMKIVKRRGRPRRYETQE